MVCTQIKAKCEFPTNSICVYFSSDSTTSDANENVQQVLEPPIDKRHEINNEQGK